MRFTHSNTIIGHLIFRFIHNSTGVFIYRRKINHYYLLTGREGNSGKYESFKNGEFHHLNVHNFLLSHPIAIKIRYLDCICQGLSNDISHFRFWRGVKFFYCSTLWRHNTNLHQFSELFSTILCNVHKV